MSARNATRRVGLIGLAALAIVIAIASSTTGFIGYSVPTLFGAVGSGEGQFREPAGVAIDDVSGGVYVYDSGNRRVEWFNSAGSKFEGQFDGSSSPTGRFAAPVSISEHAAHGTLFNLAIDNDPSSPSVGDVYVVDPGHNVIDKFTATGVYLSQLSGFKAPIFGVAVDISGDVWVVEEGSETGGNHGPVQEFDNGLVNAHITELPSLEGLRSPGIAVDPEQNLYLLKGEPNVVKFNKEGATLIGEGLTTCGCGKALAFDTSTNNLLFDEGSSIAVYPDSAQPFSNPTEILGGLSSSFGVAVSAVTNTVYASQRVSGTVALFKFGQFPDVTTEAATEVHRTSAKLEGEVNPDGEAVTSCEFEYGLSNGYGQTLPCAVAPGSGSSPVRVSAELTGLTVQTPYHYRLVAGNVNGAHAGGDQEFTTAPAVEGVLTEGAIGVTGANATLQGSLEPNGFDARYFFEYGTSESYGSKTSTVDAGSVTEDKLVSATLGGLEPNQTYDFRIVTENSFGRTNGANETFRTSIVAPQTFGQPSASFVKAQSAVLNAPLNPEHFVTHYHFEYGACPTLAGCAGIQSTPDEVSSVYGFTPATQEATGLVPSTTYSYRLVASNEFVLGGVVLFGGKAVGAEGTFTTAPAPAPSVETGGYSAVTPTSAVVSGVVNPDGLPGSYAFELGAYAGAATQYGVVFSGSAGTGSVPVEVMLPLTGLQPGTTYVYRVSVSSGYITSESHTLQGAPVAFTTGGLPAALMLPPALSQLPAPSIAFPRVVSPPKQKIKLKKKAKPGKRKKARKGTKTARPKAAHNEKARTHRGG